MIDLIPGLVTGLISGGIVGWVIGHHWASHGTVDSAEDAAATCVETEQESDESNIEQVTRKIRSLTLSVAADVSAHQSKVADITTDLEFSASQLETEAIVATVAELVSANRTMQEKLTESQQQIREQAKQLQTTRQLAYTDALTGLTNRRYFDAELKKVASSIDSQGGSLALIDIDHFKSVNDVYGHPAGDQVLGRVAELLDANLGEVAICSRFGGEEFAVLYPSSDWETLAKMLDQVRVQLSALCLIQDDPARQITFSCGVAPRMLEETNEAWIARVDTTLYAAKDDGRNNVHINFESGPRRFSEQPEMPEPATFEATKSTLETALPITGSKLTGPSIAIAKTTGPDEPQIIQCASEVLGDAAENSSGNRSCLVSQLRTMAEHIDLAHVSVAAVAIRLPDYAFSKEHLEDLLRETRKLLRAVDRIGYDDVRTMLVLMVTSNMGKTEERANQMVDHINEKLRVLCQDAVELDSAAFGISLLERDLVAEDVVAKAVERATTQHAASV